MADKTAVSNKFEVVTIAGARARQLLRGCTPRTEGPLKPARVALKEVREGHVRKIDSAAEQS